ncbi:hypothetical protein GOBAR_DD05287 [Gossypium barbadense]|nr:hypothetical protein GOBAR_DD05287 [Gossypium barbadense]
MQWCSEVGMKGGCSRGFMRSMAGMLEGNGELGAGQSRWVTRRRSRRQNDPRISGLRMTWKAFQLPKSHCFARRVRCINPCGLESMCHACIATSASFMYLDWRIPRPSRCIGLHNCSHRQSAVHVYDNHVPTKRIEQFYQES